MNYSDVEVSDNDSTSPQPQQEQQSTDQSPPLKCTGNSSRQQRSQHSKVWSSTKQDATEDIQRAQEEC